jgi:amino-acid N-acetyltransferase
VEQGFAEVPVAELPPQRQQFYNYQRRSKVLVKTL